MEHEELIEKYVQNKLSSKEELVFIQLLESDPAFKEKVTLHINLKKVIEYEDAVNFRNLIATIEEKVEKPIQKYSYTKWLVAASIALLLGLTYFFNMNQKADTDTLFAQNFEPYRNVIAPSIRSGSANHQDEKTLAFLAYDKGEYKTAIALFSKLYIKTKEPYYLFYKANALLKLERAKEAIPLLLEHLKTKDTLTQKTNWYLALAYIKLKERQKAKVILKKVIDNKSYKNKEAKELIDKFE
jgi:tetratricopeptide (TPR) repeat protein